MHEGIVIALHIVAGTQQPITFVRDLEKALDSLETLGARGALEDRLDKVVLLHACIVDAKLACLDAQLPDLESRKLLVRERGLDSAAAAAILLVVLAAGGIRRLALLDVTSTA